MIQSATLAFRQIVSPPFRTVLWRSLGLTLAMLAAAWSVLYGTFHYFVVIPYDWLQTLVDIITGLGIVVGLGFLIAPVASMFAGLFLDDIAEAVESTYYPLDAPGRAVPIGEAVMSAVRFTAIVIVVNLFVFLLVLLPGINLFAFFLANGYLLGREYFEQAAGRFHSRDSVKALREQHGGTIFLAGLVIAGVLAIPFVNLLTPLFATAFMVHMHKRLTGRRPVAQKDIEVLP
ncbi:Sulfate transporter CysZ [Hartmannibacter diazotrophicus]|uniref:Sulfate transporter CysZ n=1 Tax=Hartmannibacter diazotrophicus TaxID=1482074 RepID=A0A2C9DDQ4_9HYPH|nr:sulfate transporter family protein [Hartmannibacter diazotrophicus]SON58396.1 Sulfate transporter CysZ [Hartmannibacter diazotrophicus]